jgi:hypothetical protein
MIASKTGVPFACGNQPRPTPQSTIEAVMWCIRERGSRALREPANIERLLRCDSMARAEINQRITRILAAKDVVA